MEKKCLLDYGYDELNFLVDMGEKPFRIPQLYQAINQYKDFSEMTTLPKALLDKLAEEYYVQGVKIAEKHVGREGTEKYLYMLNDGNLIEGVFMPHKYGNTLCVSTQVGCRMGCVFCASGLNGLVRSLTAGEILSQVLAVNVLHGGTLIDRKITNVVLMGSGEPLDNFDSVVKFLRLVSSPKGINISPRNISLSTSGLAPKIRELAELDIPVVLTLSLHAATDEKRSRLMPINKAYDLAEVISAMKYYFEKTKRRLIFEYSLIDGENSDELSAKQLVNLVRGLPCHVNLINLNPVKERRLRGVKGDMISSFQKVLDEGGISNTLRHSMGNDIDGACGQLRNKRLSAYEA